MILPRVNTYAVHQLVGSVYPHRGGYRLITMVSGSKTADGRVDIRMRWSPRVYSECSFLGMVIYRMLSRKRVADAIRKGIAP